MRTLIIAGMIAIGISAGTCFAADTIEFKNGAKLAGKVLARDADSVTIETEVGEKRYKRRYALEHVAAITTSAGREVIGAGSTPSTANGQGNGNANGQRSEAEVQALIQKLGREAPEWFQSTPLNYPRSLDLSWPMPPPRGWNAQRNVGQYFWEVINPNPGKWKSGIRFAHHLLVVNKEKPAAQQRVMEKLGRMYHGLLQDYGRAAFWWQHAGVDKNEQASLPGVLLAECYWKLGNKEMALAQINKMRPHFAMIKLLGEMGETDRALRLAEANLRGGYGDIAGLYAGDACRVAGQFDRAIHYYEGILGMQASGRAGERIKRNQRRARSNVEGIRLFEMLDLNKVPDGTYRAQSLGYKGPIHVAVTVRNHRIQSVRVTQHHEKQFYSAIDDTPRKIVEKQGVKGIDAVSSATMTSEAIINATAKALAGAMRK